ncbi:unnamed protein product [Spirodela intermedia]|uniref:Uncharacterized protein n=1 Tax=Spirodela intermedia TaxID=51605 RepID=A0A7I8KLM5_SPIIN|nr:unnamed protein product [Spirodela intermedia]
MKSNFSDENKVIIVLISLPNSYDYLIINLLYDSAILVLEYVIDSLMEYCHQKKIFGEAHGEGLYVKDEREHGRWKEKGSLEDKKS